MRLCAFYSTAALLALLVATFTAARPSPAGDTVGKLRSSISFDFGSANVKDVLIDGRLTWLGTSDGLIRFDNLTGEKRTYDNKSGLFSNGVFYVGKLVPMEAACPFWTQKQSSGRTITSPTV